MAGGIGERKFLALRTPSRYNNICVPYPTPRSIPALSTGFRVPKLSGAPSIDSDGQGTVGASG